MSLISFQSANADLLYPPYEASERAHDSDRTRALKEAGEQIILVVVSLRRGSGTPDANAISRERTLLPLMPLGS